MAVMTKPEKSLFETRPPSTLAQSAFVSLYGGGYEHSPWIAKQLYDRGITSALDAPDALADAMAAVVNGAVGDDKLTLLRAHPDLAGKLVLAELTHSSQNEQRLQKEVRFPVHLCGQRVPSDRHPERIRTPR